MRRILLSVFMCWVTLAIVACGGGSGGGSGGGNGGGNGGGSGGGNGGGNSTTASVTVIAGSSTTNLNPIDGTGTAAIFWGGGHVALDASGNIIVTDRGALRMVTQAGVVTTFNNVDLIPFSFDGVAINYAGDIFASGNILTSVAWNAYIKELTTSQTVNTFAAAWESTPDNPSTGFGGLAVDSNGNLYMADEVNNRIVKFTSAGTMSVFAGTGTSGFQDGDSTTAEFNDPTDLAIDTNGNLFVIDAGNAAIRKITPTGTLSTIANLQKSLTPIAVDPLGNIYVVGFPSSILRISTNGSTASYSLPGISDFITGLVADSNGNLYAGTRGVGAQILKISF